MDVRGRGDSDGVFVPYRSEGPDGFDSIEWCATQPWSNGKIGTMGSSYLGYDQWLAALQQPPHLNTMIVLVTLPDPFVESPTGLQLTPYSEASTRCLPSVYRFSACIRCCGSSANDWARAQWAGLRKRDARRRDKWSDRLP
jgi:putative CocE/NonD family hydrolase